MYTEKKSKRHKEVLWEILERRNTKLGRLSSKTEMSDERVSEFEDRSIKITQSAKQREKWLKMNRILGPMGQ